MEINIGFGINNEYCQHCAATMASVLVNADKNDEYNFYIVSDKLSNENIDNLEKLKKIRNFNIIYISIDKNEFADIAKSSNIHIASFNRFKFFKLKNVDKILYLDSDIIVRKNIKTLYNTNLDKYYISGAKDIVWKTLKNKYALSQNSIYVNSGVLLINTKKTRKMDFSPCISKFSSIYSDTDYGDQDIINFIFQEKILEFDIKYNYCYPFVAEYDTNYYYSIASDPSIIHYISNAKPWIPGSTPYKKSEYFKYLKYTPYYKDFMPLYQIEDNAVTNSKLNEIYDLCNSISDMLKQC